jgi:hypothetical protein
VAMPVSATETAELPNIGAAMKTQEPTESRMPARRWRRS